MFSLNVCHFLVGCRVWYWQSQPASYEDCVQGHASYHPPSHDQLPHGQLVVHSHHSHSLLLTTCWNALTRNILNWLHSLAYLLSKIPFLSSGCVHLLVHLQLLFIGSSGSAQTPADQRQVEDPRENQTPIFGLASKWRFHRKHEEGWASTQAFSLSPPEGFDWFDFGKIVGTTHLHLLTQVGKMLSWPNSWRKGKGGSKIIWI